MADRELMLEIYRRMLRIRLFEEAAITPSVRAEIQGAIHTSIGQEAAIVGACLAVREDDYMTGTHRSHGHPIAKGANIAPLMAELLGKRDGVCKGKGGSMHLADFSVGSLGESGIVASAMPVATGAGLSAKMRGTDQVVLCFFGEGAANEGVFHEALNLAAIWTLPVIYFCENNQYAVSTHFSDASAVPDVATRSSAYGMPGHKVDGQDAVLVYEAVSEAVARARRGEGPSLIEAKTYRFREHSEGLDRIIIPYRTTDEIDGWTVRDPIEVHKQRLLEDGVSENEVEAMYAEAHAEVEAAVEFARNSEFPDPEDAFEDLYTVPIPLIR